MQLTFFCRAGWQDWDVAAEPAIPDRMPQLVDDDLIFEDAGMPRPSVAVNRWLRELPVSGAAAPGTWAVYARALRDWMAFGAVLGIAVFDTREELKRALGAYAAHRANGPVKARFAPSTWNQHISILSVFYQWAVAEGLAGAVPFTYAQALSRYGDQVRLARANLARRRAPKPHVTIRYLEADFAALFLNALAGLLPDGTPDAGYRGRELARNAAMAGLALATGLRRREFTFLLVFEVPPAPPAGHPSGLPVLSGVPAALAKGGKYRTTWIDAATLHAVHGYIGLDRAASVAGSSWSPPPRWGAPLLVSDPGPDGGRVNGRRVKWASLTAAERLRLVAPSGGSCLLAVRADGGSFTAWESVFTRASKRIRARFEPRFPLVHPHRLRHSMAIATLERLVGGFYVQAVQLAAATGGGAGTDAGAGPDAALALYLAKSDPLMVLRDLLGHSSALTTEAYLRRLDMTRIYADAYEQAANGAPAAARAAAEREAATEFDTGPDEPGDAVTGPDTGGAVGGGV
jgi:integrase